MYLDFVRGGVVADGELLHVELGLDVVAQHDHVVQEEWRLGVRRDATSEKSM